MRLFDAASVFLEVTPGLTVMFVKQQPQVNKVFFLPGPVMGFLAHHRHQLLSVTMATHDRAEPSTVAFFFFLNFFIKKQTNKENQVA